MASTNQHLLAQSDAITANADEVRALYGLQHLDAAKRAQEFLQTVCGMPVSVESGGLCRVDLPKVQVRGFKEIFATLERELKPDPAAEHDAQEEAAREDAGE